MYVKAEYESNGEKNHKLFNTLSEAKRFAEDNAVTSIFNYMIPGLEGEYNKPVVGVLAISDNDDSEIFSKDNRLYTYRSYMKLIEDCNAKVVPITCSPLEGAVNIDEASEDDFDRIIVLVFRHRVTHGTISKQLEKTYGFISKLKNFVVLVDDPEAGFFMPSEMPGLGSNYSNLKLDSSANVTVIHGNTNEHYVAANCVKLSSRYKLLYAPISVSSINYFGYSKVKNTEEYDHVYSGYPRLGGRMKHFEEFIFNNDKAYTSLWVGADKDKIESKLNIKLPDNLTLRLSADEDYLRSTYGSGLTTTIADHDVHRSMISWRIWEAYLSDCIIFFDKDVPPTSNMSILLGGVNNTVANSSELYEHICRLRRDESYKLDMLCSQQEILSRKSKSMLEELKDKLTYVIYGNI